MKKLLKVMTPALLSASFLISCGSEKDETANTSSLDHIITSEHRSETNKARDKFRHPKETLTFFEVSPEMTVVEIWPGGSGWYTEILAPYLKDNGKLLAAQFSPDSSVPYFQNGLASFQEKLNASPEIYSKVELTVLQPPEELEIAPANSADRILTFRNVHNWMKSGDAEKVFTAMYKALKPGGILGVVEHRADPAKPQDPEASSGYVSEDYVISLAQGAGFELVESSEINANSEDDRDHPNGVWSLLPRLRVDDDQKEAYTKIGESDRMTLKFLKPDQ